MEVSHLQNSKDLLVRFVVKSYEPLIQSSVLIALNLGTMRKNTHNKRFKRTRQCSG
jgi:hypothetical protein